MRRRILSLAIVALVVVLLLPSPAFAMGNYVASKNSDVYHDPDCSYVGRIKESNKVWFNTVEEAEASGRRGCSRCNPDSGNYASKSGSASGSSTGDSALSYSEGYTAGYSAGLADGISDGYDAGMEDGYSDGYRDGEKAAREQAESEYAVKIEEAEKSASIRTAIGTVILCVPISAFAVHVILNRELDREKEAWEKQASRQQKSSHAAINQTHSAHTGKSKAETVTSTGPAPSSAIKNIDYKDGALILTFTTGGTYSYYNVPESVYKEMLAAPSKGKFFHERIKDEYPYL